jgi:ferredoxin
MAAALSIDRIRCDGYGMCAELLPELIDLDDWGYPILRPGPVPRRLEALAQRAVEVCPVLALKLQPAPHGAPATRHTDQRAAVRRVRMGG